MNTEKIIFFSLALVVFGSMIVWVMAPEWFGSTKKKSKNNCSEEVLCICGRRIVIWRKPEHTSGGTVQCPCGNKHKFE